MSGGVDSAVTSYLLKLQGYDVYGITFVLSDNQIEAAKEAQKICDKLEIPLFVENLTKEFNNDVTSYFVDSYLKGEIPNPCVLCNQIFKFKNLIDKADKEKIDFVATGHYSQVLYDNKSDRYILKKAKDLNKDQSYFLYRLTQKQLSRIILPLWNVEKEEVRSIAKDLGLEVSEKKDSQDICFIKEMDYTDFIKRTQKDVFDHCTFEDMQGNPLGQGSHHIHYTPGQRRGLGKGFNKRMYVIKKDAKKNKVILGDEQDLFTSSILVDKVNLIMVDDLDSPTPVKVKIRNTMKETDAIIYKQADKIKVDFLSPVRAAVNGQSAVFYQEDSLLGGGIIHDSL